MKVRQVLAKGTISIAIFAIVGLQGCVAYRYADDLDRFRALPDAGARLIESFKPKKEDQCHKTQKSS